jgi:hypothetical protein
MVAAKVVLPLFILVLAAGPYPVVTATVTATAAESLDVVVRSRRR